MKNAWKRSAVVLAVLSLVCAAIYFNGRYAAESVSGGETPGGTAKVLGEATAVDNVAPEEAQEAAAETTAASDYFASARLARSQARDSALSLLQEASEGEGVDEATASEAAKSIEALASCSLAESQIESMITAKGYEDCVVFLASDSVSVVVAAGEDGLQSEDVARITDIVKQETGLKATAIRILEA